MSGSDANDANDANGGYGDAEYGPSRRELEGANWLPDDVLEALQLEQQLRPAETAEASAKRILRENVAAAAMSIAHLAVRSENERIRLRASEYLLERVFAFGLGEETMTPEEQIRSMGAALTGALAELGLDPQSPEVRRTVRRALVAVATTGAGLPVGDSGHGAGLPHEDNGAE